MYATEHVQILLRTYRIYLITDDAVMHRASDASQLHGLHRTQRRAERRRERRTRRT